MELKIASPCPMSWDHLRGDDRVRFCDRCRLNVYNLADMGEDEVGRIVRATEGRLCARLYQRGDGTALAQDCPVGRQRKILRRIAVVAGILIVAVAGWLYIGESCGRGSYPGWLSAILDWFGYRPYRPVVGKMPLPLPPP